jgi:hypothetical protein
VLPVYTERPHITELPYFREGIYFMAPQTDLPTVWDSYQNEHSRPCDESDIIVFGGGGSRGSFYSCSRVVGNTEST